MKITVTSGYIGVDVVRHGKFIGKALVGPGKAVEVDDEFGKRLIKKGKAVEVEPVRKKKSKPKRTEAAEQVEPTAGSQESVSADE